MNRVQYGRLGAMNKKRHATHCGIARAAARIVRRIGLR
jgi:hypothetical protein